MPLFVKFGNLCFLTLLTLVLCNCQQTLLQKDQHPKQDLSRPQSSRKPQSVADLIEQIKAFKLNLDSGVFRQDTCLLVLAEFNAKIYDPPSDYYMPKDANQSLSLINHAKPLVQNLFQVRGQLASLLSQMKQPEPACVSAVRTTIRYTRFIEDFILEWVYAYQLQNHLPFATSNNKPALRDKLFSKDFPFRISTDNTNPHPEFLPGDIFLLRGVTFGSASVARISDDYAQFSHLAIVTLSPEGEKIILEAIPTSGVVATKIDDFLHHEYSRAVHFRPKDAQLAKLAAERLFLYFKPKFDSKKSIPYDFKMNPNDQSQFFCAEIVSWAYDLASDGKLKLPIYPSTFMRMQSTRFLKDSGIMVTRTFSPADIEVDPNFQVLGEYRDLALLRNSRLKDAILTAMFHWMSAKNYYFVTKPGNFLLSRMAWFLRQAGFMSDQVQKHVSPAMISTYFRVEKFTQKIEKHLAPYEEAYFKQHGHSLNFKDMQALLEEYRALDCKKSLASPKQANDFHSSFNVTQGKCEPQKDEDIPRFIVPLKNQ